MEDIKKRMLHVVRTTDDSGRTLKNIWRHNMRLHGCRRTLRQVSKEGFSIVMADYKRMVDQLRSLEISLTRTLGVRDLIRTSQGLTARKPKLMTSRWRQQNMPPRPDSPITDGEHQVIPRDSILPMPLGPNCKHIATFK